MLFILPIAIEGTGTPRHRRAWLSVVLSTLVALVFLAARLAYGDLRHGWSWYPDGLSRATLRLLADLPLYPRGSGLFAPWQLWSYALLADGWGQAVVEVVLLAVLGRAIERALGAAWLATACIVCAPLAVAVPLIAGASVGAPIGASGVIAGFFGLLIGRYAAGAVRWAAGYWLVVMVGATTFRVGLTWVAVAWAALDLLRLAGAGVGWPFDVHLCGCAAGFGLAAAVTLGERHRAQPERP